MRRVEASSGEVATEERRSYLTRADVARLLGVSPNTVTRWAREGKLPCQITLGGHHRFDRVVIEEIRDSLYRGADVDWQREYAGVEPGKPGGRR